jgi:hypothetical protein
MIVVTADFNGGNTNIPNLDLVGNNLSTNYIAVYEPKFLKELLGDNLYAAYIADPTEARFVALVPYLKPAIIRYVYRFYVEDNGGTFLAGTGAAKSKKQNASNESAWPLIVKAWNQMVGYNKDTYKFLHDNPTYPEYTFVMQSWYWGNWYPFWNEYQCLPEIYRVLNGLGL